MSTLSIIIITIYLSSAIGAYFEHRYFIKSLEEITNKRFSLFDIIYSIALTITPIVNFTLLVIGIGRIVNRLIDISTTQEKSDKIFRKLMFLPPYKDNKLINN